MLTTLFLLAGLSVAAADTGTGTAGEPVRGESTLVSAESSKKASAAEDPFDGAVEVFHYGFEPDEDRNFDRMPDGWIRRKGKEFPAYVDAAIDREHGHGGKGQSLQFKANGGRVILYSKP
ncbi:MAG TPA: hypothetical protein VHX68_14660, partial [Planctomycetaceae bacterium]|nr:hypothetical protein [Planctomycetaceae bacterium]